MSRKSLFSLVICLFVIFGMIPGPAGAALAARAFTISEAA